LSLGEKIVWDLVKNDALGVRFRRQFPIDRYFLDFYCAKAKLCIEVDGEQHESRLVRDARRDEVLSKKGIETLRVTSLEVIWWRERVLERIRSVLADRIK